MKTNVIRALTLALGMSVGFQMISLSAVHAQTNDFGSDSTFNRNESNSTEERKDYYEQRSLERKAELKRQQAQAIAAARLQAQRKAILAKTALLPVPEPDKDIQYVNMRLVQISVEVTCKSNRMQKRVSSTAMTTKCMVSPLTMTLEGEDGKIHKLTPQTTETDGLVLKLGAQSILAGRMRPADWELIEEAKQRLSSATSQTAQTSKFVGFDRDSLTVNLSPEMPQDFSIQYGVGTKNTYSRSILWQGSQPSQKINRNTTHFKAWKYTANGRSITQEIFPVARTASNAYCDISSCW